jgi:hypothetical protein
LSEKTFDRNNHVTFPHKPGTDLHFIFIIKTPQQTLFNKINMLADVASTKQELFFWQRLKFYYVEKSVFTILTQRINSFEALQQCFHNCKVKGVNKKGN